MAILGLQAVERAIRDEGVWAAAGPITFLPDPKQTKGTASQAKMATISRMLSERESLEQLIEKQKKPKDAKGAGRRGGPGPGGSQ